MQRPRACSREAGARVVVTFGNDAEAAERLVASLPGAGPSRQPYAGAGYTGAIESLAAAIGATEGRLDILVNNAGSTRVIPHADLRALDDAFFDFVLAVNLRGPFATVRACQPLLEGERAGPRRQCRLGVGRARRRQQHRLRRGQGRAARDDDVLGAGIGAGDPGRRRGAQPDGDADDRRCGPPQQRAQRIAGNPLKRIAEPEEVAAVILGLATTMTFVNGAVIPVDGGSLL